MKVRVAGVCAAVAVALTGSAVATPGVARAELSGVCGTVLAGGLTAAGFIEALARRGAPYVSAFVVGGCLASDVNEVAREYTLTPAARAEYRRIQARYGNYGVGDYMREFGCTQVTRRPSNADDVFDDGRTSWDCSRSPVLQGD